MKHESTRNFLFVLILMSLIFTVLPMSIAAQENDDNNQEQNKEQDKEDQEKPKLKIFNNKYRSRGDMIMALNLGLYIPLGLTDYSAGLDSPEFITNELGTDNQMLSAGGVINISWEIYLLGNLRVGGQLSPSFAYTKNQNIYYMVPLTARITYEIQPIRQISIPVYLGLGLSFNYLNDDLHIDFVMKPGLGFYWNMDIEWSFGVDFNYMFMPQVYSEVTNSRIGHFLEISASVNYHF